MHLISYDINAINFDYKSLTDALQLKEIDICDYDLVRIGYTLVFGQVRHRARLWVRMCILVIWLDSCLYDNAQDLVIYSESGLFLLTFLLAESESSQYLQLHNQIYMLFPTFYLYFMVYCIQIE